MTNSNLNNATFDSIKAEDVPDVVLIRKLYDRTQRIRKRQWKLKRLYNRDDGNSTIAEFNVSKKSYFFTSAENEFF